MANLANAPAFKDGACCETIVPVFGVAYRAPDRDTVRDSPYEDVMGGSGSGFTNRNTAQGHSCQRMLSESEVYPGSLSEAGESLIEQKGAGPKANPLVHG